MTETEGLVIGDVVKQELPNRMSREVHTVAASQTLVVGQICQGATGAKVLLADSANEVQTLTLAAGTDGGTFKVYYKEQLTGVHPLVWNISAANLQIALRALHADLVACTVDLVGEQYTVTVPETACDLLNIQQDVTADGGVWEGGISVARTSSGAVAGASANCIILENVTTGGGETQEAVFLVRDSLVDVDQLSFGANVDADEEAGVLAILKALGILNSSEPALAE